MLAPPDAAGGGLSRSRFVTWWPLLNNVFLPISVPKCQVRSRTYKNTEVSTKHKSLTGIRRFDTICLNTQVACSSLAVNNFLTFVSIVFFFFWGGGFFPLSSSLGVYPISFHFSFFYSFFFPLSFLLYTCRVHSGSNITAPWLYDTSNTMRCEAIRAKLAIRGEPRVLIGAEPSEAPCYNIAEKQRHSAAA